VVSNDDGSRATAQRLRHRHRGVNSEFPCLIGGRCHNASHARAANEDWLAAQARIIALFDRCEKGVEIGV